MECLAGIFEWDILLGFLIRIDLNENFKEDFGKSSTLIYLKKEVELFFDKNPLEVPFGGAYRVFYRWKVFSILGKYFPRVFWLKM